MRERDTLVCMDAATLLRRARLNAGLSQRELADKAKTSASAICLYESGQRVPRVDTLGRLLAAADTTLVLDVFEPAPLDTARNGEMLLEVVALAEHLPFQPSRELDGPTFASLAK